eukprot:gene20279-22265_t
MIAFPDEHSHFGDAMNFPESENVKKKAALSNTIFKITQSSEKERLQCERLLNLNFQYEQKLRKLETKRDEQFASKLKREKAYYTSHATSNWLKKNDNERLPALEIDNSQSNMFMRNNNKKDKLNLRDVNMKKSYPSDVKKYRMKRAESHPVSSNNLRESIPFVVRLVTAPVTARAIASQQQQQPESKHVDDKSIKLSTRSAQYGVKYDNDYETGMIVNMEEKVPEEGKIVSKKEYSEKTQQHGNNENPQKVINDHLKNEDESKVFLKSTTMHEVQEKSNVTTQKLIDKNARLMKLLQAAHEWSQNSCAYIPGGSSGGHMCSTQRKYAQSDKCRIITRYFRESREMKKVRDSVKIQHLPQIKHI